MRISGFSDRGEARIVDDAGRLVAFGELRLVDTPLGELDPGDHCRLEIVVTWTAKLPDPDEIDFDDLDFGQLLT
jgi:hypothetical protein